jgi:hypothetical protein
MSLTLGRLQWPAKLAHASDDYYGLKVAEILPLLPMPTAVGGGGAAKGIGCSAGDPSLVEGSMGRGPSQLPNTGPRFS